jgi:hypothetical protein
MLVITIPNNNLKERRYIIEVLFGEFLGLDYRISTTSGIKADWEIVLENGNRLIFEDHFFNSYPEDLEYLQLENIPTSINYIENEFLSENSMPILFGTDHFEVSQNDHTVITTGVDIFASSFFMLSRWEEYVNKERDSHNRFPASESLAYKNDFLNRPIVNEYLYLLQQLLVELEVKEDFKRRTYELLLTHDVDYICKWDSFGRFARHLAGDLVVRRSIKEFFSSINYYLKVMIKLKNDPYYTFDYIMDVIEKV